MLKNEKFWESKLSRERGKQCIPTFCRVTREDLFVSMTFELRFEKNSDSRTMQIFKQALPAETKANASV